MFFILIFGWVGLKVRSRSGNQLTVLLKGIVDLKKVSFVFQRNNSYN